MSRIRVVTVTSLVVLTATGCAGQGGSDAAAAPGPAKVRADVERVWNAVYDAARAGDGKRFCGHVTSRYARRLIAATGKRSCAEAGRAAGKAVSDAVTADAKPSYSSFSTSGHRATILVTLPTDEGPLRNRVRFRLADREWKVDGDSGLDAAS